MIFLVENNTETLSAYVARVMDNKKLSSFDVEKRSNGEITQSYVIKIKNGDTTNVSASKLKALAVGLGVMEEELFAVARGRKPNQRAIKDERFESLALKFDKLPVSKKEKAEELFNFLDDYLDKLSDEQK